MYLILFFVGIVLAFAGALLVRYGVPVVDAASSALFTSGIISFVGGTVMVGLSAVVRMLSRIAERLEMQPVPVPPIASVGRDDPAPRPARTPPAAVPSAPARPSLLGWFGRGSAQAPATTRPEAAPPAEPAVDLAPLTRVPEEPRPAPIPPPPLTPAQVMAPPPPPVAVKPAPVTPKPAPVVRPAAKPAPANGPADATIYKSGVIDGMAYTLFMDGSIEAELPQGRVKFASVEDLQKHILGLSS